MRRTDEDVAALSALLQRLHAHLYDPQPAADIDAAFHIGIAAATHNPYYRQLLQYLNLQLHQAVATARANTLRQAGLAETVHAEHEAIVEAIRRGDRRRQPHAAVTHLQCAARRLALCCARAPIVRRSTARAAAATLPFPETTPPSCISANSPSGSPRPSAPTPS